MGIFDIKNLKNNDFKQHVETLNKRARLTEVFLSDFIVLFLAPFWLNFWLDDSYSLVLDELEEEINEGTVKNLFSEFVNEMMAFQRSELQEICPEPFVVMIDLYRNQPYLLKRYYESSSQYMKAENAVERISLFQSFMERLLTKVKKQIKKSLGVGFKGGNNPLTAPYFLAILLSISTKENLYWLASVGDKEIDKITKKLDRLEREKNRRPQWFDEQIHMFYENHGFGHSYLEKTWNNLLLQMKAERGKFKKEVEGRTKEIEEEVDDSIKKIWRKLKKQGKLPRKEQEDFKEFKKNLNPKKFEKYLKNLEDT